MERVARNPGFPRNPLRFHAGYRGGRQKLTSGSFPGRSFGPASVSGSPIDGGEIGRRIVEAARANGIPPEENPALAEALSHVELEHAILEALYRAVAEVLAFILRSSGKLA